MDYYNDVYLKRLNRYGNDYQSRIQGQREKVFEDLLLKSIYRIDFIYNNEIVPGLLEPYKQDETKTLQYLLLRIDMNIPAGTILQIPNKDYEGGDLNSNNSNYWMIYYLENMKASGYNRYIVLKMTHEIEWTVNDITYTARGYFYGKEAADLVNRITFGSTKVLYGEDDNYYHFITPLNKHIKKDNYFELKHIQQDITEAYRITGYDTQSTLGVEYITLDPVYIRDRSVAPEKKETDSDEDFYWLNGGK